ncbi:MAG TPA: discoidin domain-containing protein, partial [Micromonosporaceae bacterium]
MKRPSSGWMAGLGMAAVLSVTISGAIYANAATETPTASATSQDLPVSAVTASEHDGNVPQNTRDNNLTTRWSAEAIDRSEWIRYDLGTTTPVHYLNVAWYQGDQRRTRYQIQTSNDATTWTTVATGESSGTTLNFETYDFPDTTTRYVQIVSDGNTLNDWVSITEVKIFGGTSGTPSPSPTGSPTASPSPSPTPSPTPSNPVGYDPNGVKQVYPTRTGRAAAWTLGYSDWATRFNTDGGSVSGSGKTTVVTNSGQVRMSVESVDGTCDGITDHGRALSQGYMCSTNDWTNWELTGYVQLATAAGSDSDQDWTWYGNGGRHTGDGTREGCKGSAYKGSYHYRDADVRWGKESYHVNYDYKPWTNVTGGYDYTQNKSRWLGMKVIRYEFSRGGQRGIRLETWLDLSGVDSSGNPVNSWQKVRVVEDHPDQPSWGTDATYCNAPRNDQVMLWGGPYVTFRWDNTTSRLRLASAREIVPPT